MKKTKIPVFKSVAEEAEFWDTHSFADHWGGLKPVDVIVELAKPKEETLVVRVNKEIKKKLEVAAKQKGLTISTLARMLLTEKLRTL